MNLSNNPGRCRLCQHPGQPNRAAWQEATCTFTRSKRHGRRRIIPVSDTMLDLAVATSDLLALKFHH